MDDPRIQLRDMFLQLADDAEAGRIDGAAVATVGEKIGCRFAGSDIGALHFGVSTLAHKILTFDPEDE